MTVKHEAADPGGFRSRRNLVLAVVLGLIAAGFYLGFILTHVSPR